MNVSHASIDRAQSESGMPSLSDCLRDAPFAVLMFRPDAPYTLVWRNMAHAEMTGTPDLDVVGRGIFDAFPPTDEADGAAAMAAIHDAVAQIRENGEAVTIGPYRYDLKNAAGSFEERHWTMQMSPVYEAGKLSCILQVAQDMTESVLSGQLAVAQKRAATQTTAVTYFSFDRETGIFERSSDVDEMFGFAPGEVGLDAGPFFERVAPEDLPGVYAEVERVYDAPQGEIARFDYRVILPDGQERFVRIRGEMATDPRDRRRKLVGTFADVTDFEAQRIALQEQVQRSDALVTEANHRIKNSLMIALASLRSDKRALQGRETVPVDEAIAALNAAEARVRAVSSVHGLMEMTTHEIQASVTNLLERLVTYNCASAGTEESGIALNLSCDNIVMDSRHAVAFGLIANEIITNALKYGYDGTADPNITVSLTGEADQVVVEVCNPILSKEKLEKIPSSGIGAGVVAQMADQLEATIDAANEDGFYRVRISIPNHILAGNKAG